MILASKSKNEFVIEFKRRSDLASKFFMDKYVFGLKVNPKDYEIPQECVKKDDDNGIGLVEMILLKE